MTEFRARCPIDDAELSALHARAFKDQDPDVRPWRARLERHALTWIGAFAGDRLIGFVQVAWDGGEHAVLLDTIVDPAVQRSGIGVGLVAAATAEARAAGCRWLHVDFEEHLADFYVGRGGFRPTAAGLVDLSA